eukprot:333549_1
MNFIGYHSLLKHLKFESSEQNLKCWTKLKSFPLGGIYAPTAISHNQFVVAPNKTVNKLFSADKLYQYNSNSDKKWNEYIKYPNHLVWSTDHCIAFDAEKQLLYVHNRQANMLLFDIKSQQSKVFTIKSKFDVRNAYTNASVVIINNTFHLIGGMRNTKHITFNNKLKTFSSHLHYFKDFQTGFYGHCLAHIKRKNMEILLLFGGTAAYDAKSLDCIYKYDVLKMMWSKVETKLPKKLSFISCVVPQNQKYVILFGGVENEYNYADSIYVYDIDNNKILESKIKCPNKQNTFGAVIQSDFSNIQTELLIEGYLRNVFEVKNYPMDIVSVVKLLFNAEYVHLTQVNKGTHWKILVADLISKASAI